MAGTLSVLRAIGHTPLAPVDLFREELFDVEVLLNNLIRRQQQ